jgi:hypothetical protein
MKFSRPAAVFAAVVLLAGGIGVAVNAVETSQPVKLCSNNKTGAVTVPTASGDCPRGTTAFFVGSDSDILALANRVGAAESAATALATRVAKAESSLSTAEKGLAQAENAIERLNTRMGYVEPGEITVNAYVETNNEPAYQVNGSDLAPGSSVVAHFTTVEFGVSQAALLAVDDYGNFAHLFQTGCNTSNVYFTGTAVGGTPVSSVTTLTGPGC